MESESINLLLLKPILIASLEKSPTKKVKTQCNHLYAAMIVYCNLEMIKFKTGLNHFAIKYKLIVRANQIAMQELKIWPINTFRA